MNGTKRDIIIWGEYVTKRSARLVDRRRPEHPGARRLAQRLEDRDGSDVSALARRYRELTTLTVGLIEECRRVRQENEDLRRSAELWVDLYQRQLDRANGLAHAAAAPEDAGNSSAPGERQGPESIVLAPKPDRRHPDRQAPRHGGRRATDHD